MCFFLTHSATYGLGKENNKEKKKKDNDKLAIHADHPHHRIEVKVCMPYGLQCVVLQSSFIKLGSVVLPLWVVENRPFSLLWRLAYTTACVTVQAVIRLYICLPLLSIALSCTILELFDVE